MKETNCEDFCKERIELALNDYKSQMECNIGRLNILLERYKELTDYDKMRLYTIIFSLTRRINPIDVYRYMYFIVDWYRKALANEKFVVCDGEDTFSEVRSILALIRAIQKTICLKDDNFNLYLEENLNSK